MLPFWKFVARAPGVLLAALLGLGIACGDVPNTVGDSFVIELAPGALMEAEFDMTEGDAFEVDFASNVDLVWDVHSHVADDAITHVAGTDASATIEFEAPETRLYWAMWTNLTSEPATVAVHLRLMGSTTFNGWIP